MDRDTMLMKLSEFDFAALDLQLFLDTHPADKKAIEQYNMTVDAAGKMRADFEKNFGPLTSFRLPSNPDKFTWIESPWPWEM